MRRGLALLTISAATLGVAACAKVLGLEEYAIVADAGCWDPKGFGGGGCFRCEAGTDFELMNACTEARCVPFDDRARIPGFDGAPAPLPDVVVDDVPETDVADAAVTDTGTLPPLCSSLKSPVYVYGSTALEGVLEALAQTVPARTIVYKAAASCNGVRSILAGDPQLTGEAVVHPGKTTCRIDGAQLADIGISDVGWNRCEGISSGGTMLDSPGPIQVFMFAVPKASAQRAISAEAAFRVYGYGSAAGVAPWLDDKLLLRRHILSGTQITIGKFIGLPEDRWSGERVEGSSELANRCLALTPPSGALCITSADQLTKHEGKLPNLAYQHRNQSCAFFPDSVENGVDKLNVRDGHYVLWAPVHLFTRENAIAKDAVRDVLNALTGVLSPTNPEEYFGAFKKAGLVPRCAMRVTRDPSDDYGPLKPFAPEVPCGCAFENASPGSAPECAPCADDKPCGKGKCRFGFCEKN